MSETNEEDLLAQLAALGQADQFAADKAAEREREEREFQNQLNKIEFNTLLNRLEREEPISSGLAGRPTSIGSEQQVRQSLLKQSQPLVPEAQAPTKTYDDYMAEFDTRQEKKPEQEDVTREIGDLEKAILGMSASGSVSVPVIGRTKLKTDMESYEAAQREAETAFDEIERYESADRIRAKAAADEAEERLREADNIRGRYKFDPYKAMPTLGSKIAAGIAIALGEAARGLRGGQGENIGLNMINQAIDREMKRQQSEYQKLGDKVQTANNLYARNLQILGNAEAAEAKTKAMMIQQAKVKVDSLLRQADQEQLNARYQAGLDANLAKANAQARVKTNAGIFGKPATLAFIRETVGDLKAATEVIGTITQAKSALRKMDLGAVREMAQALQDDGNSLLGRDSTLTKIKRLSVQKLNEMDEAGRQSFMKKLGDIVLSVSDESYAGAQEFGNIINLLAFGMAKQGQSSSSISNRDVQMFVNVLADAAKDPQLLFGYMDHLQQLADFDAKVSNFLTKPDQNGIIPQSRGVNHGQARAVVAERNPNVTILPNGTIETDFIRYLKNTNQLDLAAARGLGVEGI
jgi:hypothetical protein